MMCASAFEVWPLEDFFIHETWLLNSRNCLLSESYQNWLACSCPKTADLRWHT